MQPAADRRALVSQVGEALVAAVGRRVREDVVIVVVFAAEDGRPGRTAERVGDEELRERHPLIAEQRPQSREPLHRGGVEIVRQDEDDVRRSSRSRVPHANDGEGQAQQKTRV